MKQTLIALLLAGFATSQASAALVFSDRGSWNAAVSLASTVGFEGISGDNTYVAVGGNPTIEGVTFLAGSTNFFAVIGKDYAEGGGTFCMGTGACLFTYNPGLDASVGTASNAFAFDLRGYLEGSTDFSIEFDNGDVFSLTAVNPGGSFFGVVLDQDASSFKIRTASAYTQIDNISYGSASAVPEPTGLALVGLALSGLVLTRRRGSAV